MKQCCYCMFFLLKAVWRISLPRVGIFQEPFSADFFWGGSSWEYLKAFPGQMKYLILQVLQVPKGLPPFAMPGNSLKKGPGGILIICLHSPSPSSLCMSSSLRLYCCWGFRHLMKETSFFFQALVCLLLISILV